MIKVLFITNKDDLTTDFVVREIQRQQVAYYRLNTEEIGISVLLTIDFRNSNGYLYDTILKQKHALNSFSSVYFRRPVVRDYQDGQLSDAERQFLRIENFQTLEGLYKMLQNAFWVSSVISIRNAENKIFQQLLAAKLGLAIPQGIITNNDADFNEFCRDGYDEYVVKSIRSGQVGQEQMEKIAYTSKLEHLPDKAQIEFCPTYLQHHIRKYCDIRVTAIGRKLFATAIMSQENKETKIDWRYGEHVLRYEEIELPDEVADKCRKLMDNLDLRFGAIDFILDSNGKYWFLEINPNGQWAWIECRTNYKISFEIANLLINGVN